MASKVVLHIMPKDGFGGVESAARSMPGGQYFNITFYKYFLVGPLLDTEATQYEKAGRHGRLWNPLTFLSAIQFIRSVKPDVVIASLWWSVLVVMALRCLHSKSKIILFLHANATKHFIDWLFNKLGMYIADEIWADSQATLDMRLPPLLKPQRVISFCTQKVDRIAFGNAGAKFVFWGRLAKQKNLTKAIKIFRNISLATENAQFFIIGPDNGEEPSLRRLVKAEGLNDSVEFIGPLNFSEIQTYAVRSTFFLQTSYFEGMSMSTVEAMQMGLIPLVTPVGEIANYCVAGKNAILIESDKESCQEVTSLLKKPHQLKQMSQMASDTWRDALLYREDILGALQSTSSVTEDI